MVSGHIIASGCTMPASRALSLLNPIPEMTLVWYESAVTRMGVVLVFDDASSGPGTLTGKWQGTSGQGRKIVFNLNDYCLEGGRLRAPLKVAPSAVSPTTR
jgi:hypothetical protein